MGNKTKEEKLQEFLDLSEEKLKDKTTSESIIYMILYHIEHIVAATEQDAREMAIKINNWINKNKDDFKGCTSYKNHARAINYITIRTTEIINGTTIAPASGADLNSYLNFIINSLLKQ